MVDELKEFKVKRGTIKSQLTNVKKFLDKLTPDQAVQLPDRLQKCEELWSKFEFVQDKLEFLEETQIEERTKFEDSYFEIISILRQKLNEYYSKTSTNDLSASNNSLSPASVTVNQNNTLSSQVKLPPIDLPRFSGSYDQWITFYDTFRSLIHINTSLTNIQKLYYLKSCLTEEAAEVLRALEVTENNYEIAWGLLKDRYENKRLISHNHIKALFELQTLTKESLPLLRKLHDDVKKNIRALKSLGQPVQHWDNLLIYLVSSKLDNTSKREWEKLVIADDVQTMDRLFDFLSQRCQLLETLEADQQRNVNKNNIVSDQNKMYSNKRLNVKSGVRTLVASNNSLSCYMCKESHSLFRCEKFLNLPVKLRVTEVKKLGLCFNCLRANHSVAECVSGGCKRCNKRHNSLLHLSEQRGPGSNSNQQQQSERQQTSSDVEQSENQSTSVLHSHIKDMSEIILSTALVYIADQNNRLRECRVLLDSASQSNFISTRLCKELGLKLQSVNIPVVGINQSITTTSSTTQATIISKFNNFKIDTTFLVIDQITGNLPTTKVNISNIKIPGNIILADAQFNIPRQIDLLIGATVFWDLICVGQIRMSAGQPIIQKTKLGWIISGSIPTTRFNNESVICNLSSIDLQDQLQKFWTVEENVSNKTKFTEEEQECEDLFKNTTIRHNDGHFEVTLPTKGNINDLGDSYETAVHRFSLLEKRFRKNDQFKKNYSEFMEEYERLGHMSLVKDDQMTEQPIYYLPHHGVYKETSQTTKLRIVFDGSARTSTGISLNDKLKTGPTLQDDLFSILLRFRKHKYVMTADVAKMYRMVFVNEDQRDLQRILWRSNTDDPIQIYKLNTLTYGTTTAPYLAIRCLQQIAHDNMEQFPEASGVILSDFYVDDLITGTETIKEAKQLKQDLTRILSDYGFHLRKWSSNNDVILEDMHEENRNITHLLAESKTIKTLGLTWNSKNDTLHYEINVSECSHIRVTKRSILSAIAQVFDPLGLVSPCIIKAKLLIQRLWQLGTDLDESVPFEIHSIWTHFCDRLPEINSFHIPRYCLIEDVTVIQLHGFSDSSELAYGACVYVRTVTVSNQFCSRLLCAKSRVAPLKKLTLPRLELCGALLLARLMNKVIESLCIDMDDIFYYTDSNIVLAWIAREPAGLKTFVANRVSEIRELTNVDRWKHVRGKENPADLVTRGSYPNQLATSTLWWKGPPWLEQSEPCWPGKTSEHIGNLPDVKIIQTFHVLIRQDFLENFSTLLRLQRVTAYIFRFANNSRVKQELRKTGPLEVNELEEALRKLIEIVQLQMFDKEVRRLKTQKPIHSNSNILSLNPFLHEDGLLRVGGRLGKSNLSYDNKHPILLPRKHHLTKLIIEQEHRKHLHVGPQTLLAIIRQRYWPIAGRSVVREIFAKCKDSVIWHFLPPGSPHFGGLWEAAVKSAKYHLTRVMGNITLTYEEFLTLLTQVEAILNSRPLSPISSNPNDLAILTPGHFLIGDSLVSLPEPEIIEEKPNRLSRYQHLTQMAQHFWHRWSTEYLSALQQRTKWMSSTTVKIPQVGTTVLIKDERLPTLKWLHGRILDLAYGNDGIARVAIVKTVRGVMKRPVRKLCPLPLED